MVHTRLGGFNPRDLSIQFISSWLNRTGAHPVSLSLSYWPGVLRSLRSVYLESCQLRTSDLISTLHCAPSITLTSNFSGDSHNRSDFPYDRQCPTPSNSSPQHHFCWRSRSLPWCQMTRNSQPNQCRRPPFTIENSGTFLIIVASCNECRLVYNPRFHDAARFRASSALPLPDTT